MNKIVTSGFRSPTSKTHSFERTARSGLANRRVLVVDDDARTTRLIKLLLEKRGSYEVLEDNDPTRAHQTAQAFRPDVILLDIVMPDVDGGEVAAQIQQDPKLRNTPIIFVTALVTKAEARGGLEIQGQSFLAKPISVPELLDALAEHLPAPAKAA
jgi:two-component system OmpR family response regulator